jgi:uncharacterized protein (TIGR02246 family)
MDTSTSPSATPAEEQLIRDLYDSLLRAWNQRDAARFASYMSEDGVIIGFDGTVVETRAAIASHLGEIFANHEPPAYVQVIQSVRFLNADTALLRGAAGMPSLLTGEINPSLNSVQTLVAVRSEGAWRIALFQNTPAQFHGRPDLVARMTEELQRALDG